MPGSKAQADGHSIKSAKHITRMAREELLPIALNRLVGY